MSGLSVIVSSDFQSQPIESEFRNLMQLTAQFKQLEITSVWMKGKNYLAAKLDSPVSVHAGVVKDEFSDSWIMACGTVVSLKENNHKNKVLIRLLRDYIDHGTNALEGYDGHFALVIYNSREDQLSVIADPVGMFSIFYHQQGSRLLVSNSAFALAALIHAPVDIIAVEHFLRTGRLDGDKTLWQDIKSLLGGRVLTASNGKFDQKEYWSPTYDPSLANLSLNEALDQSSNILKQTFSHALHEEEKTWVDLTGGFDSRLAAIVTSKINVPFKAYCLGPEDNPDVRISRQICEVMGWEYLHSQLPEEWSQDQYFWFNRALGCGDGRANLLRLAVTIRGFEERKSHIDTNLMGVGGENLRGYFWQIEKANMGRTTKLNYDALLNNVFSQPFPIAVMRYNRTGDVRHELSDFVQQITEKYSDFPNTFKLDIFEIVRDSGHGGAYLSAVSGINRSLAPLCFKAPINFAISLNYKWKYPRHHVFVRTLIERENKILANLDTTTGGPAIPIRFSNMKKFWPLWKDILNSGISIGSKKILRKNIQIWPTPHNSEYPLPEWRSVFHDYARKEGLLQLSNMRSGGLYEPDEFKAFVEQSSNGQSYYKEFLDRVLSIEMGMRLVGADIN
ncbi:MAG TPA: hypothetical protein VK856_03160 [Anaerolineaceae bacterium]|nr:hypothetical protein [Anaerolineaceae bacterium]